MLHVVSAKHVGQFQVELTFNDGFVGIANFESVLNGPIFMPLNDPEVFKQFELQGHTLCWKNGADFAPEYLRELASAKALQAK
jgi:hypothetical protein